MAELEKLVNLPMEELRYEALGVNFQPSENKKFIEDERERYNVINAIATVPETFEIWASETFNTKYGKRIVEVKKGKNTVPPELAIHLLQKYGIRNRYGLLAQVKNVWVHDEPTCEKFDFAVKATKEKKAGE